MTPGSNATIDPRLIEGLTEDSQTQPQAGLPPLPLENAEDDSDDNNEASEKRRKLNLWKCKQCRDARKKCLPEGRVWPQKCIRCRQHKPLPLDCSEPELNLRKRGPSKQAQRAKAQSTPDTQEPRILRDTNSGGTTDHDSLPDAPPVYNRPVRQPVVRIKKETASESSNDVPESQKSLRLPQIPDYPASLYLDLGDREFRVLLLAPAPRKEDAVVFSFVTVSESQTLNYEVVSYLWGGNDGQKMKDVEVRDPQGQPHFLPTKASLYAALQNLRHPTETRPFWVDAFCINRRNIEEKNRQVKLKRYIFHNATNLCFWLGEDADSKLALAFVPKILDLTGVDELVRDKSTIGKWETFVALLKNTVFSRLWLVQEVAVARNVTLHCGQEAIHYGDLVDAVATFISFRADISLLFRQNQKKSKDLMDRKMVIAERFIDISTNALRVCSSGKVQRLLSLEGLVSQLSDLGSGDPRDRIFAVLPLAKDGPKLEKDTLREYPRDSDCDGALRIDYDKTTLEVYQDFVLHAIENSGSLDIICRHWASSVSERDARLPTWVRPFQSFLQSPFENSQERTAADSLVGLPDHTYYHASRGTKANFRVERQPSEVENFFDFGKSKDDDKYLENAKSLFVRGRHLDTIDKLGPRASEGIILYEWLELGGCSTTGESVPENFWRTLVADRGPNGSNAPSWYCRAFIYCLQHLTPTRDINTNKLIAETEAESSLVLNFLLRVQSVIWNRKFLVSKRNRWIGLAPMAADAEDIICVLHGCSVPVVLRPLRMNVLPDSSLRYLFVGECYIHGMMDGEAVEMATEVVDGKTIEKPRFSEEEFELL